jgi:hypothetical protein
MWGVERVALEDHRDVPAGRIDVVHHLVADGQLAVGNVLQAGDHPQGRGLAAARRAEEHHELAVVDGQIEVVDRGDLSVALRHGVERDAGHATLLGKDLGRRNLDE